MFWLGFWEMLIVLAIGGVLVAIVLKAVKASSNGSSNFDLYRIARLEEENYVCANSSPSTGFLLMGMFPTRGKGMGPLGGGGM